MSVGVLRNGSEPLHEALSRLCVGNPIVDLTQSDSDDKVKAKKAPDLPRAWKSKRHEDDSEGPKCGHVNKRKELCNYAYVKRNLDGTYSCKAHDKSKPAASKPAALKPALPSENPAKKSKPALLDEEESKPAALEPIGEGSESSRSSDGSGAHTSDNDFIASEGDDDAFPERIAVRKKATLRNLRRQRGDSDVSATSDSSDNAMGYRIEKAQHTDDATS